MSSIRRLPIEDRINRISDPRVLEGWLDYLDSGQPLNRDRIPGERDKLVKAIARLRGRK